VDPFKLVPASYLPYIISALFTALTGLAGLGSTVCLDIIHAPMHLSVRTGALRDRDDMLCSI